MSDNTEINPRRILQIEIKPLLWELLVDKGKGLGIYPEKSPHQVAKEILLRGMFKEGMLPKTDPYEVIGEFLYGVGKLVIENKNNNTQQELADNLKKNNFKAELK